MEYLSRAKQFILSPETHESFENATGASMTAVGIFLLILAILIWVSVAYGAVRLSWCYNAKTGTSMGLSVFYGILCFFFSGIYYPFYSLFLHPSCSRTTLSQIGGRKRN